MAQLCALDLLQAVSGSGEPAPEITSVGFATPAVGNTALAAHVAARGWARRFVTYLLPGGLKAPLTTGRCCPWNRVASSQPPRTLIPLPVAEQAHDLHCSLLTMHAVNLCCLLVPAHVIVVCCVC